MKRKEQYKLNKSAKVGETIVCPICKETFVKKSYQQAFCCGTCKDKYWNDKKDRHKDPDYYRKYNKKHPERFSGLLGLGFSRAEREHNEALYHLATDEGFRDYVNHGALDADGSWDEHNCHVDLATQYENYIADSMGSD